MAQGVIAQPVASRQAVISRHDNPEMDIPSETGPA